MKKQFIFLLITVQLFSVLGQHTIKVTDANIQRLYRNCANYIEIDVPDLCSKQYLLMCKSDSAEVQQVETYNYKFCVIPKGYTCTLSVFNLTEKGEEYLGELKYKIIEPPKPKIELLVDGQVANSNTVISRTSQIKIRFIPDILFQANLPNDAHYEIGEISLFMYHRYGSIEHSNTLLGKDISKGIDFALPPPVFQTSAGNRLFLNIEYIYRINYKGEKIIDDRFSLYEKSLSLIIN